MLTRFTKKPADYLGVPVEGPYKPEHSRCREFLLCLDRGEGQDGMLKFRKVNEESVRLFASVDLMWTATIGP